MSFTPDQSRKIGTMVTPSPAPFLTPRPERRRIDARWVEGNSVRSDREKEVNVQVILRCRPQSEEEQRLNVPKVISCNEQRKEVTLLQSIANKQVDRFFTFDKVFGPKAQQRSIYDQAISPIVNEVLEGFNCTVFAYGQTGTGKTYTMEGGMKNKGGELPLDAGVIPRAVRQIFESLESQKADYCMKVTFLEIYNEEITDLLAPEDSFRSVDDKQRKPISLMEDGKGGVIVRGLEEEVVYSATEIYSLLERGSAKRRTADTLLNKRSSRSHSIFSIIIHVKEPTTGDEDLVKCGKLNLVDLAGSENISRSGAREGRAREAGEINKSLLTLGRVINALVEHSAHIPYRDSKLTRLLRDSLGGKTKTCIIATISPSAPCLDETLSTIDYACRAKNIKNKPEANQKMSKSVLLKDLYLEIERMKQDVRAAREKNGVYVPHERFVQDEAEKKAMVEKIEHLEFELGVRVKEIDKFRELYHSQQERNFDLECEVKKLKKDFKKTNKALEDLLENHRIANLLLDEKEGIISNLLNSENAVIEQSKDLCTSLQAASEDITNLFSKLDHKNKMEADNHQLVLTFGSQLDQSLKSLHKTVVGSISQQHQQLRCMEEHVGSFIASKCEATKTMELRINKLKDTYDSGVMAMKELTGSIEKKASSDLDQLKLTLCAQTMTVENFLTTAVSEAEQLLHDIQTSLDEQKKLLDFSARQQEEGLQRSLVSTQVISKATIDFFHDLHNRANTVTTVLEETHKERIRGLTSFEKTFQEESAKEEKVAVQKISKILAALAAKKTNMVSGAFRKIQTTSAEDNRNLQQQMLDMKQLSTNAEVDWISYIEKVESQFQEVTFSAADTRATMANILEECSKKVDHSKLQWEKTQSSINHLNKSSFAEIESTMEEKILANQISLEEFASVSSSADAEFDSGTNELLTAANDSLLLDHQAKAEMESISTNCFDLLRILQESHSGCTTNMRNRSDHCLRTEYMVDQTTPVKMRPITVPSLASIEELRTPIGNLASKIRPVKEAYGVSAEMKQQQSFLLSESTRAPLTSLNQSGITENTAN